MDDLREKGIDYEEYDEILYEMFGCSTEEELEYAGIIGPIIEPMVPREILITDEKKLEDVLLSIQENGLLPDGMVHTIANEEIKRTPQGL